MLTFTVIRFPSLNYFSLKIVATRVLGFWSNRHTCFANIAKLKASRFRNSIPPSNFDDLNQLPFTHCTLPFSTLEFHQNLASITEISWHNVFGSKNTLIVYKGINCNTTLIKISQHAYDRNRFVQLVTFFQILSINPLKVLYLDRPTKTGRPRYLSFSHFAEGLFQTNNREPRYLGTIGFIWRSIKMCLNFVEIVLGIPYTTCAIQSLTASYITLTQALCI